MGFAKEGRREVEPETVFVEAGEDDLTTLGETCDGRIENRGVAADIEDRGVVQPVVPSERERDMLRRSSGEWNWFPNLRTSAERLGDPRDQTPEHAVADDEERTLQVDAREGMACCGRQRDQGPALPQASSMGTSRSPALTR